MAQIKLKRLFLNHFLSKEHIENMLYHQIETKAFSKTFKNSLSLIQMDLNMLRIPSLLLLSSQIKHKQFCLQDQDLENSKYLNTRVKQILYPLNFHLRQMVKQIQTQVNITSSKSNFVATLPCQSRVCV